MKTLLIVAVLLVVAVTLGFTFKRPVPQSWEYHLEYKLDERKANQLGAEGWELVAGSSNPGGLANNIIIWVFKRPKQ